MVPLKAARQGRGGWSSLFKAVAPRYLYFLFRGIFVPYPAAMPRRQGNFLPERTPIKADRLLVKASGRTSLPAACSWKGCIDG